MAELRLVGMGIMGRPARVEVLPKTGIHNRSG